MSINLELQEMKTSKPSFFDTLPKKTVSHILQFTVNPIQGIYTFK